MNTSLGGTVARVLAGCLASVTFCGWLTAADEKGSGLSARQIYFVAKPAAAAKPAATSTATKAASKAKQTGAAAATGGTASSTTPPPAEKPAEPASKPAQAAAAGAPRLGLRFSIQQVNASGQMEEVDVEKSFKSGEQFGVALRPNEDAFLYVVVQGSSGNGDVLFPNPGERNRVFAGKDVMIPPKCSAGDPGQCFAFDNQPGEEKMFIVLSKLPETDFDQLIKSVRQKGNSQAPAAAARGGESLMAASLPGSEVDRMHKQFELASRDIIRQTVKKNANAGDSENAMYAVAKYSGPQQRVVLDIVLKHR